MPRWMVRITENEWNAKMNDNEITQPTERLTPEQALDFLEEMWQLRDAIRLVRNASAEVLTDENLYMALVRAVLAELEDI